MSLPALASRPLLAAARARQPSARRGVLLVRSAAAVAESIKYAAPRQAHGFELVREKFVAEARAARISHARGALSSIITSCAILLANGGQTAPD